MSGWMVGIDIGGTFTDVAAMQVGSGRTRIAKTPSTPHDPSLAVTTGLAELIAAEPGMTGNDIRFFAHGTTVATNTIVELKGARVGLLVTRGTGAIYGLRGGTRPVGADLIDPMYQKPKTLVSQALTIPIGGRLAYDGTEVEPLDEDSVRRAIRDFADHGVTSVAVCYLFSYVNPMHEVRTKELIAAEAPQLRVSLSSQVLPVVREYRRLSTTVLDAYVGPAVEGYLNRVEDRLGVAGVRTDQKFLMQSNGGLMRLSVAASHPSQTVLSGPAAGVAFGAYLGQITDHPNLVTFDIGGTSTDISLIANGVHERTREGEINGQDLGLPMIQIRTLGAGGGAIAWIGPDGLLKVGPESAGADPGPACYGAGGTRPTVTDASVVLGYLEPSAYVGGGVHLDPEAARQAIDDEIAKPLGISIEEAALGIMRVTNVNIEVGLRLSFIERGLDPRHFALLAFGGAGPVHAAQVARDVGMPTVLVPPHPGIGCAMGLLQSDVQHDYIRTRLGSLGDVPAEELDGLFGELETQALREAEAEGFTPGEVELFRQLDLRYPSQGYELTVSCDPGTFTEEDKPAVRRRFDQLHEDVYRTAAKDQVPDVVNVRVMSTSKTPQLSLTEIGSGGSSPDAALRSRRHAWFEGAEAYVEVPVYDREGLLANNRIDGPAIVTQFDSTVVILADQVATVDQYGNLILTTEASADKIVSKRPTRAALDPITLEVIHNRLGEITGAMQHVLFHSGYSTILRESHDGSAGLCLADAQTVQTLGAVNHLYPYHKSTVAVLETYGPEDIHDGDSFIITDPYEAGSSHLPDLVVVTPVFVDGELFAFSVSTAHKPDLGGLVPGSSSPNSREIYHEGLLVPTVRYWTSAGVNREVEAIIRRNSRVPDLVIGDLNAQVGCTRLGADRLAELCAEYTTNTIRAAMIELLDRTENRLRNALLRWPDGEVEAESFIDDDGVDLDQPIRLHVKATKIADRIIIDYSGTSDQVKGPINLGLAVSQASALLALITYIDPSIPLNDGAWRVIEFVNPPGKLTNPLWPAPVNSYYGTMNVLADTIGRALSKFNAERAYGSLGYGLGAIAIGYERARDGKRAVQYELFISSRGGTPRHDGVQGVNGFSNHVPYTPIEILETEFPVRVHRYEWTMDSAGPGRYRGGSGLTKEYELLGHATVTFRLGHQFQHGGFGVLGGGAPTTAHATFTPLGGQPRELRPLETVSMRPGDRFHVELPGGGGYGHPYSRDPQAVLRDVQDGYVSQEAAKFDYGVVISPDHQTVDYDRTHELRGATDRTE
jgi:N-methylhydantoinase A/oxoprolinase/acetone carboxylase beta subunit/N-methylhydantoinase B/oxoprolinase/acetone carboxylase alpha subunit